MITEAESPAAEPKNSARAGAKSPEDMPCRYISGSTSVTLGLRRHHGVRIWLRNPAITGLGIDPAVAHPRRLHLDRPGAGGDPARLGVAVTDHQTTPPIVSLVGQSGDVRVHLRLQRGGQHPPRPLGADLIDGRAQLRAAVVVGHYSQHRRSFLAGVAAPTTRWLNEEGTPRPQAGGRSTTSGHTSATQAARHHAYGDRYQRTKARLGRQRGSKVARVDIARCVAEANWHMLTKGEPFAPAGPAHSALAA